MTGSIRRDSGLRAVVAAIAAYAFVLQMLLGGIVVTQMAAAGPAGEFVRCEGGGSTPSDHGKSGPPFGHLTCALCSLLSSAPPLPHVSAPAFLRLEVAPVRLAASNSLVVERKRHSSQSSRGPPPVA